jgi:outer membrane protein assembly factor BamB
MIEKHLPLVIQSKRSELTAVILAVVFAQAAAEDWPQFRGPRGDGTSLATKLPLAWSETNNIAWKTRIPGRGRSSPVVLENRIFLTTALEQNIRRTRIGPDDMQTATHVTLKALCVDRASGKILWDVLLFEVENPDAVHWLNSWATPTPVVEPGRFYCDFGTFGTACLDSETGKVFWQRKLALDHQVGPGSSLVLYSNLLVLVRDGRDAQYVTALDKMTGETVWKTDRPAIQAGSPNLKKSFSSPLFVPGENQTQMIATGPHWVVSYDPLTGKETWRARHGEGFSIGTCPVFAHGLAFIGTGCFKAQILAIRADGKGDVTATHVAWKSNRAVPVMSSPVLAGDEIYWVSDDGMACCSDARTGQSHWQERLGGSYLASPILAAGHLHFFSQEGKTTVLKPGRTFARLAENTLLGPVIATPAVAGQALFLRSDSHLYRIEGR